MFRCVVRKRFDSLSTFVRLESRMDGGSDSDDYSIYDQETELQSDVLLNQTGNSVPLNVDGTISPGDSIRSINGHLHSNRVIASSGLLSSPSEINELEFMGVCRDAGGGVHILGNTEIGEEWDDSLQSKEQIEANLLNKFEAAVRRERAQAYSFSHQVINSSVSFTLLRVWRAHTDE
ncbi:hypothetical protein D5086_006824 [Populus alba]|uniref:Uncharacterized protein n=1 Tax=Populus alba TaxID=43335 RepID=A0ACC4CMG8_POPAL